MMRVCNFDDTNDDCTHSILSKVFVVSLLMLVKARVKSHHTYYSAAGVPLGEPDDVPLHQLPFISCHACRLFFDGGLNVNVDEYTHHLNTNHKLPSLNQSWPISDIEDWHEEFEAVLEAMRHLSTSMCYKLYDIITITTIPA